MNALRLAPLLLALGLAATGCASTRGPDMLAADAPRALPQSGPVSVAWNDPAGFTELRHSRNVWDSAEGNWLPALAEYLRTRAQQRLGSGERLELTIIDIDRAGDYEPWLGLDQRDTRIVRDIYPPRMTLQFRHIGADGRVLSEGERKLTDPGFLTGSMPINSNDPLRFEKRMIDAWLRRELMTAAR
ncbi:MAG: DUF3016 domain-containing protein [Pseudomonadota bacterium]